MATSQTAVAPQAKVVPATFPERPLDRLNLNETISDEWPDGFPTENGWHRRVRIVNTTFKSGWLRIEDHVEIEIVDGSVHPLRAVIGKAMVARHVLVSAQHMTQLEELGIPVETGRNANYLRVLVDQPELTSSIPALCGRLKKLGLTGCEPDAVVEASAQASDPLFGDGLAWHLDNLGLLPGHRAGADINAQVAWDRRTDASSVLVAVIDTGISSGDPELAGSIRLLPGETIGDNLDNDGNGYIDDALGYDFYHNDPDPEDESGHGSMCAALIGATGNNGSGSTGVAWQASILNCKFMDNFGLGALSDAIDAIDYARVAKARILNLSWSYDGDASLLREALTRCDAKDILMVCASGNSGFASQVPAPASIKLRHLVTVAASTPADTLASFSVVDPAIVDLAAPGVDLPIALDGQSWSPLGSANYATGTSFSAAIVSGSLALGLAEFSLATPHKVVQRMLETVDPLPGGAAALSTGGRLNLGKMLGSASVPVPHDAFAERGILTDASGQWSGRNDGADTEAIDSNLALSPAPQRSIWFEWTAPTAGMLRVTAHAVDGTPVRLAVFARSGGLPSSLIAKANHGETLEIPVVAGKKMFWLLDSSVEINRGLKLSWQLPPTNDNWRDAPLAEGLPLSLSGNSLGATVENFEQPKPHQLWLPQGSVWWKWTPGETGNCSISVTADHVVFILPLDNGRPKFELNYEFQAAVRRQYSVEANQSYALLVIPLTPAAAGPFKVALTGMKDIAILVQPSGVAALEGETVELGVQVAASNIPTYQWFKNDEAIPFATQPTLKLSPVARESYGIYQVTVTSATTMLKSDPAVVIPRYDMPRLVGQTPRRSVVTGQSIELDATFRSTTDVTYSWLKNGQPISDAKTSSYTIPTAKVSDSGTYSLTATNSAGSTLASFQVDVISTPWKGWVNRTPSGTGTGAILSCAMTGNDANAFTATEWLRSSDGGRSWKSTAFPANVVANACAAHSNGSAILSGFDFSKTPQSAGIWRYTPGGGWKRVTTKIKLPNGSTASFTDSRSLTFFDGEWWTLADTDGSQRAIHSADGVNWTALADPVTPGTLMRATELFRFEDRLAIAYWTSYSYQTVMLRIPGGASQILNYETDVRAITRIGGGNYASRFNKQLKIADGQSTLTVGVLTGMVTTRGFVEGKQDGDLFFALKHGGTNLGDFGSGELLSGVFEQSASARSIGFSCFAKSGDRWLVGYPDGKLWSGSDLTELPSLSYGNRTYCADLDAYHNEFVFGKFHSSDGAKWQLLGAATTNEVRPLGSAGGNFLHSIREIYNLPTRSFMSSAIYPSALGSSDTSNFQSYLYSGENSLLQTDASSNGKITRVIRDKPPGLLVENAVLGVDWDSIDFVRQLNGYWYAGGDLTNRKRFLMTSRDGKAWKSSKLPPSCVLAKKGTALLAIQNSSRGYTSTNGSAWTPFTPKGLPVVNVFYPTPKNIVAYRGYYLAQYPQGLYSSADGISWALSSAPLPIAKIVANQQTILAVSTTGEILQPGGETASGPSIVLPTCQHAISVSRHQGFSYELMVEDADGDLAKVSCAIDGKWTQSLTAPPFVFNIAPDAPGSYAIEFMARDKVGRTSRVTSTLTVLSGGVYETTALIIDSDLSRAVFFKDDYYRVHAGAVCIWEGKDLWKPVTPHEFTLISLVANGEAIVASTASGILTSQDGLKWTHLGGFNTLNQTAVLLGTRDGAIRLRDLSAQWTSQDGISWEVTDTSARYHTESGVGRVAWVDATFGLKLSYGNYVTYNGGKFWLSIPGDIPEYSTTIMPLANGFLLHNENGVFRILRGETRFTRIDNELGWGPNLYSVSLDGLAIVGEVGRFLKSTKDGVNFTDYVPPPNNSWIGLRKFSGEWLACSGEMISASKDLRTWRIVFDLRKVEPRLNGFSDYSLSISGYGLGGLLFKHPKLPTLAFALKPDFSVTQISAAEIYHSAPDGRDEGLRFKNRIIALSGSCFTKLVNAREWEQAPLFPSEGFVTANPQSWPTNFSYTNYPPLFAATANRFVMLGPDNFNVSLNHVFTSDDGRTFTVHHWTGPIPLPKVTRMAASPGLFLAAVKYGRVIRSTDGITWTVHPVADSFIINSLLHFNGKWHAAGTRGTAAEVWTSSEGIAWTRSAKIASTANFDPDVSTTAFIARGIARMHAGALGWLRSSDGTTWQTDTVLHRSMKKNGFQPRAEHPQGIIGQPTSGGTIVIINAETGALVRKVDTGAAAVRFIDGWPYLSSPGRFLEWSEADPRLTAITSSAGVFGVGDYLTIELAAQELADPTTPVRLLLTTDQKLGNADDIILASPSWEKGVLLAGGKRRFTIPLPPSITAGRFKVAARLEIPDGTVDNGIQNNQITTAKQAVEIPGYELRLTTSGQGDVNASDPRVLYPRGTRLQLEAIPRNGFTFRSWAGSMVSSEAAISVVMKADKQLTVTFTPGNRIAVSTIGHGTINGAPPVSVFLPGETVQLSQSPAAGWTFQGWFINGVPQTAALLSYQPAADTLIEGVFVPDYSARRDQSFLGTAPDIDRSWTADPDGDGLSNWQEILLSTDPLQARGLEQQVERTSAQLRLVFSRPQGRLDSPWITPEFSENLVNWESPDSTRMTERLLSRDNGIETIEVTLPFHTGQRGFFHLKMADSPVP